jgi:hypothetical protein
MQRRIENRTRGELTVERVAERVIEYVAWNAAAGAALAVMVLVLLFSLQWLDQVAPAAPAEIARSRTNAGEQTTEVAAVNRPSG